MDQIAVISDVHGNLEALKAVLCDIKERKIDRIICLGDTIAKGTHQEECINLVKEYCSVVVKGNCDVYFTSEHDLSAKPEFEADRIRWNRSKLSEDVVEYVKTLPFCHEFYLSGRLVRMFHAHPSKIAGFVGNIDTMANISELFLPGIDSKTDQKADIVVYGHIHMPYIQKLYNRVIINAGSVGNALDIYRNEEKDGDVRNTTVAGYAILRGIYDSRDMNDKISYELVSVPYDIEKELSGNADNNELDSYREELTKGQYRNMENVRQRLAVRVIDPENI